MTEVLVTNNLAPKGMNLWGMEGVCRKSILPFSFSYLVDFSYLD